MEITTRIGCKNRCAYCPQNKLINAYNVKGSVFEMSLETFKKCIDKLPKSVDIEFSGFSEPWLNKECTQMALYAHARGHRLRVYTTLVGMTIDHWQQLKDIPFESFWIHLPTGDGSDSISVDDQYLELLKEVSVFFDDHQGSIDVSYHVRGKTTHSEVKQVLGDRIENRGIGARSGNVEDGVKNTIKRRKGKIGCKRNLRQNILLPNGDVVLCCMDYGLKHSLGNLLTDSYQSLFESDEFKRVNRGLSDGSMDILCRYCDMLAYDANLMTKIINKVRNLF